MNSILPGRLATLILCALLAASTGCRGSSHEHGHEAAHEHGHEAAHEHGHEAAHEHGHEAAHEHGHEAAHEHGHEAAHGEGEVELPAGFTGPGRLELAPDLRGLLIAEMVAIEGGMHKLLSSMARSQKAQTAALAGRIRDSFVLARELTEEQRAQLGKALPPEFVALDRAFHTRAGSLAEAAEAGDMAEAARLYGQMVEACVRCHSAYARERFAADAKTE